MALLSFQRRFVLPIKAGTKCQTIRAPRKHAGSHGKPGGPLTLVTGSRFKPERIGNATCSAVLAVTLELWRGRVLIGGDGIPLSIRKSAAELDAFAVQDGFQDWQDMEDFWEEHHPEVGTFVGRMTMWENFV